jgi:hypothetical protein
MARTLIRPCPYCSVRPFIRKYSYCRTVRLARPVSVTSVSSGRIEWIILCGSSRNVTRHDGSDISCQLLIFVFHRFSFLPLPLHPSLFLLFRVIRTIRSFLTHHPRIYLRFLALEPVLCVYTMLRSLSIRKAQRTLRCPYIWKIQRLNNMLSELQNTRILIEVMDKMQDKITRMGNNK